MLLDSSPRRVAGLALGLGVCLGLAQPGHADALTAAQIVDKCRRAYDALPSYQGTSETTSTSTSGGSTRTYHTSAKIAFARPGKIRAGGTDMFGNQYAYVSDGATTAELQVGSWRPAQSAEMAVAGVTGTAQGAATSIPALLLHIAWGNPFPKSLTLDPHVALETMGGRPCYRVLATGAFREAFWIDKQTFLLTRLVTDRAATGDHPIHQHDIQTFTNVRTGRPIPGRTFAAPAGR